MLLLLPVLVSSLLTQYPDFGVSGLAP